MLPPFLAKRMAGVALAASLIFETVYGGHGVAERNYLVFGFFQSQRNLILVGLILIAIFIYATIFFNKGKKHAKSHPGKIKSPTRPAAVQDSGIVARGLAHELRTPLTNISLAEQQLRGYHSGHGDSLLLLDIIQKNLSKINELVSELLASTKFEPLFEKPTNIHHLLEELLREFEDRLKSKGGRVIRNFVTGLHQIPADPDKLRIAFREIIDNAIEVLPQGQGVLEIRTGIKENLCEIEIKDNGPGMEDAVLNRLFEPFFSNKPQGKGLGLIRAEHLIRAHRGNLKIITKPGKGSSFLIELNR